ncbi:MAG: pirin family protein [Desulfobacterales bacterium]
MQKHYRNIGAEDLHYLPASGVHPADTYFHFSFANYHNPDNMNFGVLRVLNDDDVKPHSGFEKHPHQEMEIVSYVVKGKLTHWDSATDVDDTLERGHVQTVTAGSGVWHSELNQQDEWTRFLQIWILPPKNGLPVRYENHKFDPEERRNQLLQIVGNLSNQGQVPLHLNQDINMFVSELTEEKGQVSYTLEAGRQAYINNFEGSVDIKDHVTLGERDSLEITGPAELVFSATDETAHFIIIEMPETE